MSSIPFRDAIIFRFPAVGYNVLPMKSFFPHRWLCGVERIRCKSRISCYYSHFILRFVLFLFVSFSVRPTSSDRFVWWKMFPFIFPLRLVCINSCLWDFASLHLPFVLEMDWLAVPTPVSLAAWSHYWTRTNPDLHPCPAPRLQSLNWTCGTQATIKYDLFFSACNINRNSTDRVEDYRRAVET